MLENRSQMLVSSQPYSQSYNYTPSNSIQPGYSPFAIPQQYPTQTQQYSQSQKPSFFNTQQKNNSVMFADSVDKEMMMQQDRTQKQSNSQYQYIPHLGETRSQSEVIMNRKKKNEYAEALKYQMKLKNDLKTEKEWLESKHDYLELTQRESNNNTIQTYNMPRRDFNGNILQSKATPGNKNYEKQDWFTHLPNVKSSMKDLFVGQQIIPDSLQASSMMSSQTNIQQQLMNPQYSQKPLKKIGFQAQGDYGHLSSVYQPEINEDLVEEDVSQKIVRIVTPRKRKRLTTKSCQTPHNPEELQSLTNGQIGSLYPSLLAQNDEYSVMHDAWETSTNQNNNNSSVQFSSPNRNYNMKYDGMMMTASQNPMFLQQFASNTTGSRVKAAITGNSYDQSYLEKLAKRNSYIQLQEAQMSQIEEKKRQKQLESAQEKQLMYLDNLKLQRELAEMGETTEQQGLYGSVGSWSSRLPKDWRQKILINDVPPEAYLMDTTTKSRKGIRPRTPIDLANDPFKNRQLQLKYIKDNQKTEIKSPEQKAREERERLEKLRKEREAAEEKRKLEMELKESKEQEKRMKEILIRLEATQQIDQAKIAEIQEKVRGGRSDNNLDDISKAKAILEEGNYDINTGKRYWIEGGDRKPGEYEFMADSELPNLKLMVSYDKRNRAKQNLLSLDGLLDSGNVINNEGNELLDMEQKIIEKRLDKMGISMKGQLGLSSKDGFTNSGNINDGNTGNPYFLGDNQNEGYMGLLSINEKILQEEARRDLLQLDSMDHGSDSSYPRLGIIQVKELQF